MDEQNIGKIIDDLVDAGATDDEINEIITEYKAQGPQMVRPSAEAVAEAAKHPTARPEDFTPHTNVFTKPVTESVIEGAKGFGRQIGDALKSLDSVLKIGPDGQLSSSVPAMLAGATQARYDAANKGDEALKDGRYLEGAGYKLASYLPFIGPAAVSIGENIGSGDPEKMGRGTADVAMMAAPTPKGTAALKATGTAVKDAAVKIAKHPATKMAGEIALDAATVGRYGNIKTVKAIKDIVDEVRKPAQAPAVVAKAKTPKLDVRVAEEAAERLREASKVSAPERSALDLDRGRVADPVVERVAPEPAPTVELGEEAARLREAAGVEGASRSPLDLSRGRGSAPIGEGVNTQRSAVESDLLGPDAAQARARVSELENAPGVAAQETGAARSVPPMQKHKPTKAPAVVDARKPAANAPKAEAAKPATKAETPTPAEVDRVVAEQGSRSKAARGADHRMSPNDRKVLAENIRKGMSDEDAFSDMLKQRAERAKTNYDGAKAAKAEREAKAEAPKTEAPKAEAKAETPKKSLKDVLVEREVSQASGNGKSVGPFKRTDKPNVYRTEDGKFEIYSTGVYGEPVKLTHMATGTTVTAKTLAEAKALAGAM
jgi:hypothetical protein